MMSLSGAHRIPPICQQRAGHEIGNNYKLGSFAKKCLRSPTSAELKEVLCFFCLDLGCQHSRGEIYLLSGLLDSSAPTTRCGTSCSICTCAWHKQFLPVYCSGVIEFIESLILSGKLPHQADLKSNSVLILALLNKSAYWKEIIFDRPAVKISQASINRLFLSLTAAGIIKKQSINGKLHWNVCREIPLTENQLFLESNIGRVKYNDIDAMKGIILIREDKVR
jgi:hypothetical protein